MPRRKATAPTGPGGDGKPPKLAKKAPQRLKVAPTSEASTSQSQPQSQLQPQKALALPLSVTPALQPQAVPLPSEWKQQLATLVSTLPPLSPLARPAWSSPDTMAASLAAYESWAAAVRRWHAELEAHIRSPDTAIAPPRPEVNLIPRAQEPTNQLSPAHLQPSSALRDLDASLLDLNSAWLTPYQTPFTLAEAEAPKSAPITPTTLHAYLVNEVTPNYRRFRALAERDDAQGLDGLDGMKIDIEGKGKAKSKGREKEKEKDRDQPIVPRDKAPLDALGAALDDLLASHVLPHITPGHSSDVASVSFLQFVVHELLPSWQRFRSRNDEAVRRAVYGDEIVSRLVESLEGVCDSSVRCGCHPQALRQ